MSTPQAQKEEARTGLGSSSGQVENTTSNIHPSIQSRYHSALQKIPPPGAGCHAALLGVANLGVLAGLQDYALESEILAAIPKGNRPVTRREIADAIRKARADAGQPFTPVTGYHARQAMPEPVIKTVEDLLNDCGGPILPDDADLWESSPVHMDWHHTQDHIRLIEYLYEPGEFVYIGHGRESGDEQRLAVRTATEWIDFFKSCTLTPEEIGNRFPHVCANPLTGSIGETKSGTASLRSDACVSDHRFAVVEFDSIAKAAQIAIELHLFRDNLACLIDSGGKSVHAWVRVNAADADEWTRTIENDLFSMLCRIGVDRACKNEARLSRLPGVLRPDKGQYQRLLWLRGKAGAA